MRNKIKDLLWVGVAYLFAFWVARFCIIHTAACGLYLSISYADLAATLAIFGCSLLHKNASLYDPYWSVAPPIIAGYASLGGPRSVLLIALISLWGARLTYNWMRRWRGLPHEDWRYENLRRITGPFYPLVNLFGIHVFPTLMVFSGLLPVLHALQHPDVFLGWIDALAILVVLFAIWIEAKADRELADFLSSNPDSSAFLQTGVWSWCRHPNYLGEISFWWGLYLFGVAADAPWWAICGPLAMTAMFSGISVPMIDKRMSSRRPGYSSYMQEKPALWPL